MSRKQSLAQYRGYVAHFSVSCTPEQREKITELARQARLTRSAYVRRMIDVRKEPK